VVEQISGLHRAVEAQHRRSMAAADFLELLRRALIEGMAKREREASESEATTTDPARHDVTGRSGKFC